MLELRAASTSRPSNNWHMRPSRTLVSVAVQAYERIFGEDELQGRISRSPFLKMLPLFNRLDSPGGLVATAFFAQIKANLQARLY